MGDGIRNAQFSKNFRQQRVTNTIDSKDLKWFGNVVRISEDRKRRLILEARADEKIGDERPRVEWEDFMG